MSSPPSISSPSSISPEMAKLCNYLKQLRQELGLSIRNTAAQCEFSPGYLAKIEAGTTFRSIGIETLVKLSKVYGISVSDILKQAEFTAQSDNELPELSIYLRTKYHLPPQAIRDMEMAKEIVDKKYNPLLR